MAELKGKTALQAGGPHQRGKYNAGLSLIADIKELGVRHFSRINICGREPLPFDSSAAVLRRDEIRKES